VRGAFCVVIHTQVPPVHTNFFELFALLDAICNSEPENVLLVFPYMPYSRSDRKNKPRISTMSGWVAHTINRVSGVKKVLLLEPHDSHIKHYFEPQAQEVSTIYLLAAYLEKNFLQDESIRKMSKIVYPDAGAAKRYGNIAHMLGLGTAYIDKDRPDNKEKPELKGIVGDVKDYICFMVDDECLTAGTTTGDAENLMHHGAKKVIMMVTHPIFNKQDSPADWVIEKLDKSPISQVIFTNSIPVAHKIEGREKFISIPIDPLLAESIKRIILMQSISELHNMESVKKLDL
jgi:ribose-phosphate pyrophosphokinase